ncbi:hypothetical protein EYE42_02965 [Paracoccus subflavus]|uniref:Sulfotransferase family protein n=2 Tax=Paracoccus subflavus TaxID=2528244 RepID=A0A4V2JCW1_9RHOB|nr:hypothetical protein EYE42_02965 [Paracoccus subflavus]
MPDRKHSMTDTPPSTPLARTAVIVLGMHRSGTSALAGVLGQLGAALPRDLMGASEMNAKGFFESNLVMDLNDRILASAGLAWWDTRRLSADWLQAPAAETFLSEACDVLQSDFQDARLFVMKDPRICRMMPFWRTALERFGARPMVVHTHRPPMDVAASLARWAGHDTEYNLLLWLRHLLDAEADSRDLPRVFTSYHMLLEDWEAAIARITGGLEIDWPRGLPEAGDDIRAFLSHDLQHFSKTGTHGVPLPAMLRTVLDILDRWAAEGEDHKDQAVLDDLRAHLDRVSPLYDELAMRSALRKSETKTLSAALDEKTNHLARETTRREHLEHLQAALQDRYATLQGDLDGAEARLQDMSRRATEAAAAADLARVELERTRLRLMAERDAALDLARRREAEFLSSTSWRVTAPLRLVSRAVRRML